MADRAQTVPGESAETVLYQSDNIEVLGRQGASDFLVISFGTKNEIADGQSYWLKAVAENADLSIIGFMPRTSTWYPEAEVAEAVETVRHVLEAYRHIVVIGTSMGGYAALKHAARLGATHVLSFAPQYSIDPHDVGYFDNRFIACFDPDLHHGMAITGADMSGHAFIFYDPRYGDDLENVRLIGQAIGDFTAVPVPNTGHFPIKLFRGTRPMTGLLQLCRAGQDETLLTLTRQRRRFANIRIVTLCSGYGRRNPERAKAILDRFLPRLKVSEVVEAYIAIATEAMALDQLNFAHEMAEGLLKLAPDDAEALRFAGLVDRVRRAANKARLESRQIMFLVPATGTDDDSHSVVQEVRAMLRLGQPTLVAVDRRRGSDDPGQGHGENIGLGLGLDDGFPPGLDDHVRVYDGMDGLTSLIAEIQPRIVVATTSALVNALAKVVDDIPDLRTAYMIHDYEPFFHAADSDAWRDAAQAFALVPGMKLLARTRWLQDVVQVNHEVTVARLAPGIDHALYYPAVADILDDTEPLRALRVAVRLHPDLPARAPQRTVRILNHLAATYGACAELIAFGCKPQDVATHGLDLDGAVALAGCLSPEDTGHLFRTTDLFLDLSDYQPFGQTAIEAMSCGAMVIVPAHGAIEDYGADGQTCLIVDTRYDDLIMAAVHTIFAMTDQDRIRMRLNAIHQGFAFSVEQAALSILQALTSVESRN